MSLQLLNLTVLVSLIRFVFFFDCFILTAQALSIQVHEHDIINVREEMLCHMCKKKIIIYVHKVGNAHKMKKQLKKCNQLWR